MGIVIACYAGVGKTYFAEHIVGSKEIPSMPYKWILPSNDGGKGEFEYEKAAPYLLWNPDYPHNYIRKILKELPNYKYIIIPHIDGVLTELNMCGVPFVSVYPNISLKEEYRERYISRGNRPEFMQVFVDEWDERIEYIRDFEKGGKVELKAGEYLTDAIDRIDEAAATLKNEPDAAEKLIREGYLMETNSYAKDGCIEIKGEERDYLYSIDLTVEENKRFAYDMGKLAYEHHVRLMTHVPFKLSLSMHRDSEERNEFPDDMKAVVLDTKEAVAEIICAGG